MTDENGATGKRDFLRHLDDLGSGSILEGTFAGIENGYFVGEICWMLPTGLNEKLTLGKE
jgi:hypothetical protein